MFHCKPTMSSLEKKLDLKNTIISLLKTATYMSGSLGLFGITLCRSTLECTTFTLHHFI